jgi:hypothetical protein
MVGIILRGTGKCPGNNSFKSDVSSCLIFYLHLNFQELSEIW